MTKIPQQWRYLKLDLFDNATTDEMMLDKQKLKLAISIQKEGSQAWMYYRAGLNSPIRNFKRGVTDEHDVAHYTLVRSRYDDIKTELGANLTRMNASKTYKKGYAETKKSVNGFSVICFRDQTHWHVGLILKQDEYWFRLNGANLTQKQRKQNIIASWKGGHDYTGYKMYSVDELL